MTAPAPPLAPAPIAAPPPPPPSNGARPAADEPASGSPGVIGGIRSTLRQTPGRLTTLMAALIALIAAAGITGVTGVADKATVINDVGGQNGQLSVAALDLYRSLSDADAAAASAFLTGGVEPPELREQYQTNINDAAIALAEAGRHAESDADAAAVARLSATLPVYTGLIETARTYNRQGMPVGAAYLREASALLQTELLPAAETLQTTAMSTLSDTRDDAKSFPWLVIGVMVLALLLLLYAQTHLSRHSHRLINPGLALASLTMVVAFLWLVLASASAGSHIEDGHSEGAAPMQSLSEAHIAAQQARSDEALALIARGTGDEFDAHFDEMMNTLIGADGQGGALASAAADINDPDVTADIDEAIGAAQTWRTEHATIQQLSADGQYREAVDTAIGAEGGAGAAFAELDAALSRATDAAAERFIDETDAAEGALSWTGFGVGALTVIALLGAVFGLQQRISEYR